APAHPGRRADRRPVRRRVHPRLPPPSTGGGATGGMALCVADRRAGVDQRGVPPVREHVPTARPRHVRVRRAGSGRALLQGKAAPGFRAVRNGCARRARAAAGARRDPAPRGRPEPRRLRCPARGGSGRPAEGCRRLGCLLRHVGFRRHAGRDASGLRLRHRRRLLRGRAPPLSGVSRSLRRRRPAARPLLRAPGPARPRLRPEAARPRPRRFPERAARGACRDGRRPLLPQHGVHCSAQHGRLDRLAARSTAVKPPPFEYASPGDVCEAAALLASDSEAKVLAGGQSLIPLLNFRLATPSQLVDLRRVPDLDRIARDNGRVRLGAMVRQRQAERSALLAEACPLLVEALRYVAHPQIRSRGTVGGSIAHADPAAELPAVLITLDGRVRAVGPRAERWIAGAELYETYFTTSLAHEEILVEIELPAALPRTGAACVEVARRAGDYALCGAAAQVCLGENGTVAAARVGLFAVGGRPQRPPSPE